MHRLRITLFSFFGFVIPIIFAIYTSPFFFQTSQTSKRPNPVNRLPSLALSKETKTSNITLLNLTKVSSHAIVSSNISLDPQPGRNFLVSFIVNFSHLPEENERINIISKYQGDTPPHPGWAISLFGSKDSSRLKLYWRCNEKEEKWLSFDRIELIPEQFYAVTLLVSSKNFVRLYLQEVLNTPTMRSHEKTLLDMENQTKSQVVYLGGYSNLENCLPQTTANLLLGSSRPGKSRFDGYLGLILISSPLHLPEKGNDFQKFIEGGSFRLAKKLNPNEIDFWLSELGRDESLFQRMIILEGHASWVEKNQG